MYINFLPNGIIKVETFINSNAQRHVEVTKTQTLRLGHIYGVEREFPISVYYVQDEQTKKFILTSTSNYAYKYKSLIGRAFESLEEMKKACLRIYKPED